MLIGHGDYQYEWVDNWATIPASESGKKNGRTHGVAATKDGQVVVFHQADPAVVIYDQAGQVQRAWGKFPGAHGMTMIYEDDQPRLWLTDQDSGQVIKASLDGQILQQIDAPPHDVYRDGGYYVPTWVAINDQARGGNGDIWVADGYGCSMVHRYDKQGQYLATITGERGRAGRFACPHGIAFDFRSGKGELYVADRGHKRVQVFDSEGKYLRTVGAQTLHSPCMFDFLGDHCLIPQLFARVDVLDKDDNVVAMLGDNGYASTRPGWPNHNCGDHPELIEPGKFNSPHGACFAPNGDIYVVEWIVGGRITKLAKK